MSDIGRRREQNEDAFLVLPERGLLVVADGMGGHYGGEIASSLAVHTFDAFFNGGASSSRSPAAIPAERLTEAIREANRRIHSAGLHSGQGPMGTTVASLLVEGETASIAWAGDSRVYLWSEGRLSLLTHDHSLLNDLLSEGRLQEEEAEGFEYKNVITRALGIWEHVEPGLVERPLLPGDLFLCCSDGLNGMLLHEDIEEILRSATSLDEAAQLLVEAANSAGGVDNITVALARWTP